MLRGETSGNGRVRRSAFEATKGVPVQKPDRLAAAVIISAPGAIEQKYNASMLGGQSKGAMQPAPRRQLLDAALELIGERGPRSLTLQAVARRAHFTLDALREHFASFEDLYLAIIEEGVAHFAEIMESWVARGKSGVERLELSACSYVDFALQYPQYFEALYELPRPLGDQRPCEPKGMNAFGVMMRALEQAQAEGDLPQGNPMAIVFPLWGLVHGIAKLSVSGTLRIPREQLLELTRHTAEQQLAGLKNSKPLPEGERVRLF